MINLIIIFCPIILTDCAVLKCYCYCGKVVTGAPSRGKLGKYYYYYKYAKPHPLNPSADKAHQSATPDFGINYFRINGPAGKCH